MSTRRGLTVQKVVNVPTEDAEWFSENYPQYGAWTWFITECLRRFRELHSETPRGIIKEAVNSVTLDFAKEGSDA